MKNDDTQTPQDEIDILSLQFLMNKSHYSQYLEKMNPEQYHITKMQNTQFEKFRGKIQHLVNHYLKHKHDPAEYEKEGCIELQEQFNQFILRAISHFQNVEDNQEDCDTMFDIPCETANPRNTDDIQYHCIDTENGETDCNLPVRGGHIHAMYDRNKIDSFFGKSNGKTKTSTSLGLSSSTKERAKNSGKQKSLDIDLLLANKSIPLDVYNKTLLHYDSLTPPPSPSPYENIDNEH
jgi:hypothetical protein